MLTELYFVLPYFFIAALGAAIHFVKVKVKSGGAITWSDYWKTNRDKSILAGLSIVGAIYLAFTAGQLNGAAAFFIGYAGDSILNKWDRKADESVQ